MRLASLSTESGSQHEQIVAIKKMYSSLANIRADLLVVDPFAVKSTMRRLPDINIAQTTCSPGIAIRSAAHLADGNDEVLLSLVTEGSVVMTSHVGEQVICYPGDVYISVNNVPSMRTFVKHASYIDIALSRWLLLPFIPNPDQMLRQRKLGCIASPAIRLLARYVESLMSDDSLLSPTVAGLVSAHIQELVLAALGSPCNPAAGIERQSVGAARLQAIKNDIVTNLTRSKLSIDDIARRHGISPQYIRTLFRSAGTTFTDFIRNERLKRAYRKLTDSRFALSSISTIAYECGFDDLSYFNRLFRRHFNMTPSEARAANRNAR